MNRFMQTRTTEREMVGPSGRSNEFCSQPIPPLAMEDGPTIPDRKALKAQYLACFAARTTSTQTLLEVITSLLHLGIDRSTLFRWGIAAGYSPATVRSLLSRAFCALGLRQRRTGGGRKPSAEALELLAHSRREYGSRALRMLRAAYRAGKAQDAAHDSAPNPVGSLPELIAVPQLLTSLTIVAPQLDSAYQGSGAATHPHPNGEHRRLPRFAARSVTETLRDYPNESKRL